MKIDSGELHPPFLIYLTRIVSDVRPCKFHYDIWYLLKTDGGTFNLDQEEFYDAKWLTLEEARKIVNDPSNLIALNRIEKMYA